MGAGEVINVQEVVCLFFFRVGSSLLGGCCLWEKLLKQESAVWFSVAAGLRTRGSLLEDNICWRALH